MEMSSANQNKILQFYSRSKIVNAPEIMGGVRNWRQRLSNFWPVKIAPSGITVEDVEVFNEGRVFYSIEQAFHYAKFQFTTKKMTDSEITDPFLHYPGILTRTIILKQVTDDSFAKKIRPFMVEVKKSSGKGQMKKADYTLDVEKWNVARVAVMEHLLLARWVSDDEFRSILTGSRGKYLLHFERSGIRSFWGGSLDKTDSQTINGSNKLGKMMMNLRDNANGMLGVTSSKTMYTQYCRSG
jgi:predicted NAD-dependent protein-ADP-ribosyltransferase YbiA (DUF1768 family)